MEANIPRPFLASWPPYPEIGATLLAAVGVAGVFLGVGTLTAQGWVTWLGLVVAAGVLASHLFRYRRVMQRRAATQRMLDARLMSGCVRLGGPKFMQHYYDGHERVILALTDDALHILTGEPLAVFTTISLFNLHAAQAGHVPHPIWDEDYITSDLGDEGGVLNLAVQMSGLKVYRMAFKDFERHAPASRWADALQHSIVQRM